MPLNQTQQIARNTIITDIASPIAITAATWGPTDGHFVVTPYALGVGCAIRIENLTLITSATALTSVKCSVALDAGGSLIVGVWTGTVTLRGVGAYTVTFEPKSLIIADQIPQSLLDMVSTQEGVLYFRFYTDVNTNISGFFCNYTLEKSATR